MASPAKTAAKNLETKSLRDKKMLLPQKVTLLTSLLHKFLVSIPLLLPPPSSSVLFLYFKSPGQVFKLVLVVASSAYLSTYVPHFFVVLLSVLLQSVLPAMQRDQQLIPFSSSFQSSYETISLQERVTHLLLV